MKRSAICSPKIPKIGARIHPVLQCVAVHCSVLQCVAVEIYHEEVCDLHFKDPTNRCCVSVT